MNKRIERIVAGSLVGLSVLLLGDELLTLRILERTNIGLYSGLITGEERTMPDSLEFGLWRDACVYELGEEIGKPASYITYSNAKMHYFLIKLANKAHD